MTLAERIRNAREACEVSQETLAQRAKMSLRAYRSLERGEAVDPHVSTVRKLAKALGVSPYVLLGEDPLTPEWAKRANEDVLRATLRHANIGEVRMLGTALLADDEVTRPRTLEELREERPETERPRIFALAGIVRDVLQSRGEERFAKALLEFEKVLREMPEAQEAAEIEDRGQEYQVR